MSAVLALGGLPIDKARAIALVTGCTAKPGGISPELWLSDDPPGMSYLYGSFPTECFPGNALGDRYDSTVNLTLARRYAALDTEPPPVIAIRSADGRWLHILDGGHRLTAARLRGAAFLPVIVRIPLFCAQAGAERTAKAT